MGGEVVPSYLRSKLSSILDEADSNSDCPSQIISRIRSCIESDQINSESPTMIPAYLLYELIELVTQCRVFSYERRTAALSKKGFGFYSPKRLLHPLYNFLFIRRMRSWLDSIQEKIPSTPSHPPLPDIEETHPIEDPSLIIGFKAQAKKIEAWLMPSQDEGGDAAALKLRAVGIVGRCGCGKTALAQKVFASRSVKKEFSMRIWVSLSNMLQFDNRKVRVVSYILRKIEDGDDGNDLCSLDKLMERLQLGLRGKRYLIVLDNAWRLDEWYEELLSDGLPRGSGGAVIVTSRREDVIRRMVGDDDKHGIRLQPHLSDEICWQIFSKVLERQRKMDPTDPKLSSIEDDVKRNFDGLPLAAKTLAYILPHLLLKTYWVPARDLFIDQGKDDKWWKWTFLPPPQEMEEVAERVGGLWVSIRGSVDMKELVINTTYSAYLVFKLKMKDQYPRITQKPRAEVRIVCKGKSPESEKECRVSMKSDGRLRKGEEEQGWMEINLGGIFTTLGDDGRKFQAIFFDDNYAFYEKTGLVIKGIEFRADYY